MYTQYTGSAIGFSLQSRVYAAHCMDSQIEIIWSSDESEKRAGSLGHESSDDANIKLVVDVDMGFPNKMLMVECAACVKSDKWERAVR